MHNRLPACQHIRLQTHRQTAFPSSAISFYPASNRCQKSDLASKLHHPLFRNIACGSMDDAAHHRSEMDRQSEGLNENGINENDIPVTSYLTSQTPALTLLPLRHNKVIHLVRHGQGYHNVAGEKNENLYTSYDYEDAHLTQVGWQQAAALKRHVESARGIRPEVVIVSPLTRAMQTAVGAFGGPVWNDADAALPLMHEVAGGEFSTAHPARSTQGTVPFVAHELCREHMGKHPCDKRRSLSVYREAFPGVDFSLVETEDDILWKADERETDEEVAERGHKFLHWIAQRPETEIAVVSHSSFLHNMLGNFARDASTSVQNDLRRLFANCELRTMVLSDSGGDGNLDTTWFHPDGLHKQLPDTAPPRQAALTNGHAI